MLTTRENSNPNYLAKIVRLRDVRQHSNADRLQCVDIDFQTVITGMDAKDGDTYVFFPVDSKINLEFLAYTNSFSDKNLNNDPEAKGYFNKNGRVRATNLRGEKSRGYIVPIDTIKDFFGTFNEDNYINEPFDTINGILLVEKYEVPVKKSMAREGKKPKVSRLIEGQVRLHVDTEKLEPNAWKISPFHNIAITYKTHGTSWWVSNAKVKKKLNFWERLLRKLGVNIDDTEYDYVYGSRKVVKNEDLDDPKKKDHFYGYDLWEDIKDRVKEHIPKGFTLYGEAVGFTRHGTPIQKGFDYGCKPREMKLEVYRITQTNEDGFVTELSHDEIKQFCQKAGLTPSHEFHYGKAYWVLPDVDVNHPDWTKLFIEQLRKEYNEKDCFMCVNKVPEEGIVLRVDDLFQYAAFKLKSFRFLEWEGNALDSGEVADIADRDPKTLVTKEFDDEDNIKDEEE